MKATRRQTVIVSLNPAIDAEWAVPEVRWEEKNNIARERRWAGGKGSNVARWTNHLGGSARLLLPLGGRSGEELAGYLREDGVDCRAVPIAQETRVNVIVTTAAQGQLRFNPFGPKLSRTDWAQVFAAVRDELPSAQCLVLSGSLPREAPADIYARLVRLGRAQGLQVILDCDGDAFRRGVEAQPFLVKPNEHELEMWRGKTLKGNAAVRQAAFELSEATGGWVLVSRGKSGAMLANAKIGRAWRSAALATDHPVTTVGAGDALLAAAVLEIVKGAEPEKWLAKGVAAGTAATLLEGGRMLPKGAIRELVIKTRPA